MALSSGAIRAFTKMSTGFMSGLLERPEGGWRICGRDLCMLALLRSRNNFECWGEPRRRDATLSEQRGHLRCVLSTWKSVLLR